MKRLMKKVKKDLAKRQDKPLGSLRLDLPTQVGGPMSSKHGRKYYNRSDRRQAKQELRREKE